MVPSSRAALLCFVVIAGVGAAIVLDRRMRDVAEGTGLVPPPTHVQLQFHPTAASTDSLIAAWGEAGSTSVRAQIRLDFWLLMAYGLAGAAGALLVQGLFPASWRRAKAWAPTVAWVWVGAAIADAGENAALLWVLPPPTRTWLQPLAFGFAVLKWALFVAGAIYIVTGVVLGVWKAATGTRQPAPRP